MASSPTLQTLAAFVVVFVAQIVAAAVGVGVAAFTLALPLDHQPWTLVVSVYAHAGPGHLLGNAVAVVLLGAAVERVTTTLRFHLFFATTGSLAGLAQVLVTSPFGPTAVLGASGAAFALLGYVLVANPVTEAVAGWSLLGRRAKVLLLVGIAALLTLATAGPGVALVAHFVGVVLGGVAGRARLLHARPGGRQTGQPA